jgi:hypothetical protein
MSDAIAQWYLRQVESDLPSLRVFRAVLGAGDNTAVLDLIRREWESRALRNDDIAIVSITFASESDNLVAHSTRA